MVVLVNRTNRMLVFNLAHPIYCGNGPCSCSTQLRPTVRANVRGKEGTAMERIRVPASLTLLAHGEAEVKNEALRVPEVAAAIRSGWVTVKQVQEAPPMKAAAPQVAAGLPATDRLRPVPASPYRARGGKRGKEV